MRFKTLKSLLIPFFDDKKWRIFLIFLLPFAIRLVALYLLMDTPRGDAADYENIALNIIKGNGFVSTRMGLYSYRPPLYPLFLACIFSIFTHSYLILGIFQAIIASITCVLVFRIGEYIFDEKTGLISSIIVASYPTLVFYSTQLLSETLFILILYLFIYVFYTVTDEPKRIYKWPLLGVLLGLGSLCRPVIFPFLFFLIPFCFFSREMNLRKWILVMGFCLLTIAPWTIRNYRVHGELVLLTTYGGANLWMGNYSGATGYVGGPKNINELVRGKQVAEVEKDKEFYRKGLNYIVDNPLDVVILSLKKLCLFWSPFVKEHIGPKYIRERNIDYKTLIGLSFLFVAVFAVIGLFPVSGVWKQSKLLLMLLIYFSLVSMIFYVSLRYRQPILPIISLFAGRGVGFSLSRVRNRVVMVVNGEKLLGVRD